MIGHLRVIKAQEWHQWPANGVTIISVRMSNGHHGTYIYLYQDIFGTSRYSTAEDCSQ